MTAQAKPKPKNRTRIDVTKAIDDMVHAIGGPLIVYETTWAEAIPSWIKEALPIQRMIQQMAIASGKEEPGEALDIEILAYMLPCTMIAPMGFDWTQIYLWIAFKCMREIQRADTSKVDGIAPKELTDEQKYDLKLLKQWLWKRYEATKKSGRGSSGVTKQRYSQLDMFKREPNGKEEAAKESA